MKKFFRFGLLSLALALCVGGGYLVAKANKEVAKPAEATALNVSFTKVREVAMERSDDPTGGFSTNSSSWVTPSSIIKHNCTATNGTTGHISAYLGETSSSKKWHAVYVEYSYTFSYSGFSSNTLNFTYSLTTTRDSTSGEADHVMEFIHQGYGSSTSHTYTLNCDKNNPGTVSSPNTNLYGLPVANRVYSRAAGTTSSGSQSFSRTLEHTTSSGGTVTFYLGLFAYIESSSYSHTHSASASIDITVTETLYDAEYAPNGGNTQYGAFTNAWNAVNVNGGTIKLLTDVSLSSGFAVNATVTVNLNGHSLTRNGSGAHENRFAAIFGVSDGKSLTITNSNVGSGGYVSTNYSTSTITVGSGAYLTVCDGAIIRNTYGVSGGGHVVVVNGGTFNLQSASLIGADSGSSTTNSCVLLRQGATFKMLGGTISGCTYAIRSDNSTSNKDSIYLGGMCNINRQIGLREGYVEMYLYYTTSNIYNASSSTLNLQYLNASTQATLPTANSVIVKGAANMANYTGKLVVVGAPDYMRVSYSSPNFYYAYREYTINYNLVGLTASNTGKGTHANNYTTTLSVNGDITLNALPTSIAVNRAGTALSAGTDYTYNSSTGAVVIYAASFTGTQSFSIVAQAKRTNKGLNYDFIDANMHMDDYTENLGYCKDSEHRYYTYAKNAFNALDKSVRELFGTSTDTKIANARERLIAWAHANGEDLTFDSTNGYTLHGSKAITNNFNANNNQMLIIAISSLALITLIPLGFFLIKKRKHQ